ncbi:MAG: DUF2953 domain-containing protein [Clostridia bacterium]|nr:DUF2953 domain-containing protein [Clostridia bacterium]
MKPLLAVLAVLGGLILLLLLVLFLGRAKIRIVFRTRLRIVLYICGFPIPLLSDEDDTKNPTPVECIDPYEVLRRERRRSDRKARKEQRKALRKSKKQAKKAKKAPKSATPAPKPPSPNLKENLEMVVALLQKLYTVTNGKFRLHVKQLHLWVGTEDAAKTAVLYGVLVQILGDLLQWLQDHFIPIRRKPGSIRLIPAFGQTTSAAEIDLICSLRFYQALGILLPMLLTYQKEKQNAMQKAAGRAANASTPKP